MNRSNTALPPPLRGTDDDSFTHHTITVRWPHIAQRVIEENGYSSRTNDRIRALVDDIPEGPIRFLDDPGAPDEDLWNECIAPQRGQSWLEIPWFFGETYFYRRILEATGYFQSGAGWHDDPFRRQKEQGYAESLEGIRTLAQARTAAVDEAVTRRTELRRLVKTALWGNQADLSMWGAGEDSPDHLGTGLEEEHLLVDDASAALDYLDALDHPARVDVWADNAGFELVTDLALAEGLLRAEAVDSVVLHVKVHPTFVSDATVRDVHDTLDAMVGANHEPTQALAARLYEAIAEGQLHLRDALTWTSPLRGRDFPPVVRAELARSDLLISKGDANYRRLLGDRHWPFTTPFEDVVSYFPAPLLALRTLKAEVAVGLTSDQVDRLEDIDSEWLTSGEWGVIQFAAGTDT